MRTPTEVKIRMYNVGFGDCFLLSFMYAAGEPAKHVLMDYGSTARPEGLAQNYMEQVGEDVRTTSGGKLRAVVATHRHRDHISGFASETEGTGRLISNLMPDYVIQPWTEDPAAEPDAEKATSPAPSHESDRRKKGFAAALNGMHEVSTSVLELLNNGTLVASRETRRQLEFLGEDNLKNAASVKNLMAMGKRGNAIYAHAGMRLDDILPGVRITVLGPPTLEQSDAIRQQRSKDPDQFWHFCTFWGSQAVTTTMLAKDGRLFPDAKVVEIGKYDPNVRWFIRQAQKVRSIQLLELVRELDNVMNNTSLILLFEVGRLKLLFPGDAQIENWAYALNKPEWRKLLADVNLYKVGHHGSLNATPKSLWELFEHRDAQDRPDRLETLCSTKSGKHGDSRQGTEVPRSTLIAELKRQSTFRSTDESEKDFDLVTEVRTSTSRRARSARN